MNRWVTISLSSKTSLMKFVMCRYTLCWLCACAHCIFKFLQFENSIKSTSSLGHSLSFYTVERNILHIYFALKIYVLRFMKLEKASILQSIWGDAIARVFLIQRHVILKVCSGLDCLVSCGNQVDTGWILCSKVIVMTEVVVILRKSVKLNLTIQSHSDCFVL